MNSRLDVDRVTMSREEYARTTVPLVTRGRAVSDAALGGPSVAPAQNDARRREQATWVHTLALTLHRPVRNGLVAEALSEVGPDTERARPGVAVGWLGLTVIDGAMSTDRTRVDGEAARNAVRLNERSLAEVWSGPEEDEAWRDL